MDSIASGAVKYINTLSDVTALLGSYPATDTVNVGKPFVFGGEVGYTVEGTGLSAIVCQNFGTYSTAPDLTTPMFWRLGITLWVDPLRDSSLNIIEAAVTTQSRLLALFTTLNFHLHRTSGETQMWGDLRTTSCQLLTGPQPVAVFDSGPVRSGAPGTTSHPQIATCFYGVSVFGVSDLIS